MAAYISTSTSTSNVNTNLHLKYLINNAGLGLISPLLDGLGPTDSKRAVFETNFWGPLVLVRVFASPMIHCNPNSLPSSSPDSSSNSARSRGMVQFITSLPAALVWNGIYATSKAAMLMLSETLRLELEPLGVGTGTVVLGSVKMRFCENLGKGKRERDSRLLKGGFELGGGLGLRVFLLAILLLGLRSSETSIFTNSSPSHFMVLSKNGY
ncbi:hypothetical protein IFR05_004886 [Cadophora sp. M221]|nr:hypothetical protein IFR05_004886 [Cadophora sp. M221]